MRFIIIFYLLFTVNSWAQVLPQKAMIESIDLESGQLLLSTGEFFLSDRLKVKNHEEQIVSNSHLEKGLFIQFWLLEQKDIPAYFANKKNVISNIKILSDVENLDKQH